MPNSISTPPGPDRSPDARRADPCFAAEEKYRTLYENMVDAFVSVDMDGRITEANQAYQDLVGYTLAELSELTYIDLTPEKWHEMEERIVAEQIIVRGHSDIYEKEYRRKDGTIVPIELHAFLLRDAGGRPCAMCAVVRDISERKRLEAALRDSHSRLERRVEERTAELRESEARFRQLSEATFEGIAVLRDGVTIDANPQLAAMLRYKPAELIGRRPDRDFVAPQSRELVARNIRSGYEGTYEFYAMRSDGTVFPAEGRGKMVSIGGQQLRISVLHDLTEVRRAEAELAAQRKSLEHSRHLAMLGEIAAGITHQIAQPLCAVTNNVAAAKAKIDCCEFRSCEALEIILDIEQDIRRMGAIAERFRSLAHPESARREPVVLDELTTKVLRLVDPGDPPDGIDIVIRFRRDLPVVWAEPLQISQMILNLLQNAIDALSSCERTERKITIATRVPEPGAVELSISDNGPGIAPDHLPHLFDPFFTTKSGGAGIGLPVCRRIVSAHGGEIQAANNPNGPGAVFRVTLPTESPQS